MNTSKDLRSKLEEVMDMITSNYTPAQWSIKNEIDKARYKEAKKVYEEVAEAIDLCAIDWDDGADDDFDAIAQLMYRLSHEIEMMEEYANI